MKKGLALLVCALLAACALSLCSCNTLSELQNAVRYPDAYTLSYEVTDSEGTVTTVTKTVDADGNVYYKDAAKEAVYILDGSSYVAYQKNAEGVFERLTDSKLSKKAVEAETAGIDTYVQESKMQFMPTAKQESDAEMLGRTVHVYKLGVGSESTGSYHYYYVDKETGICLGIEVKNAALGQQLSDDGESLICVVFETENVQSVWDMIEQ